MEKLNRIEKLKVKLHPISYPLEEFLKSAKEPTKEDEFFLKNFGIYYSPLRENRYMIRLRVDGGRIDISWLEVIIEILEKFKINAIATARSQIELHNIKRENLLEIYSILQKNNLISYQTLTDNIRSIITDPLDGFAKSSYFEAFEIIKEISKEIIKNPDLFGMLPRKFNCAIIAQEDVLFNFWNNDLLFAIAKKDGKIGFNLYGGGKFNESAKSLNIFIPKEMAKELFFKIIYYYLEYGSRGTRSKNRFYFLLEKINFNLKEELQKKFNLELEDKGELLLKESSYKIAPLKDEIFLKIFQSQKGELDIKYLKEIIEIAKKYNGKLRLSIDQNIFLFTKEKIKNSSSFSLTLTCAGSRYCPFSLWDTKKEIDEIIERDFLDVKVGFSGCLKGCGKHHHSDIGIIGIRTNLYAPTEKAIRVYIGALEKNGAGRLLYYSVPKRKFKELFLAIIDDFKNSNYKNFFEFSKNILTFYSVEFLQLWYVAKLNNLISSSIYKEFFNLNEELIIKKIKEVTNFKEEDFTPLIKELSHKAWDI